MSKWFSLVGLHILVFSFAGCNRGNDEAMSLAVDRFKLSMSGPGYAAAGSTCDSVTDTPEADSQLKMLSESLGEPETDKQVDYCPTIDGELVSKDDLKHPSQIHWSRRHGPAYPGEIWPTFEVWAKELPATIWDDTVATAKNRLALLGFAAAGATGIAINASGADDRVADHYTKHGTQLNTFWDMVGDVGGNPGLHFAVAGAMYFTALAREDSVEYERATTMINALAINGAVTLALKGIVRTRSPNGDPYGWPSGHTSSAFTFATVAYEQYGPWVGVPLLALATYVGYERIDARNHDFSDVISGAILGIAIGHAVSQNHMPRIAGFDMIPYASPNGTVGIVFSKQW